MLSVEGADNTNDAIIKGTVFSAIIVAILIVFLVVAFLVVFHYCLQILLLLLQACQQGPILYQTPMFHQYLVYIFNCWVVHGDKMH